MAVFSYEFTSPDSRTCIYEEYEAILELRKTGVYKDDEDVMKRCIQHLKSNGYPSNNGLIKSSCLVRRHNCTTIIKVMVDWWDMVLNFSKRDQLSFNYVA